MDKPEYRYNHKTQKWDLKIKFRDRTAFVSNFLNPRTGMRHTYTLSSNSALCKHLIGNPILR